MKSAMRDEECGVSRLFAAGSIARVRRPGCQHRECPHVKLYRRRHGCRSRLQCRSNSRFRRCASPICVLVHQAKSAQHGDTRLADHRGADGGQSAIAGHRDGVEFDRQRETGTLTQRQAEAPRRCTQRARDESLFSGHRPDVVKDASISSISAESSPFSPSLEATSARLTAPTMARSRTASTLVAPAPR